MSLFAPNVNSYRRLMPDSDAPINTHWGYDNRTVGLRVPHADPQARARGMVQEVDHPDAGRTPTLGNPVKMSASPPRVRKAAPRLGEDTAPILRELGYSDDDLRSLARDGVLG